MLKYILFIILGLVVIGGVIGCWHLYRVSAKNKKEMAQYKGEIAVNQKLGKVLVVYYSLSGQTKNIANKIQEKTGADLYEIETIEKFNVNPAFYARVRSDVKEGKYPEIKTNFPDFSKYDVIFVGAPIWWYTAATPVLSFLEKADFQGKKVVPFSTQGSNAGTFLKDFEAKVKNAQVGAYQSFNNMPKEYDEAIGNKVAEWINRI